MPDQAQTTDIVTEARIRAEWGVPDFTNSNLLDALCDEIERQRSERQELIAALHKIAALPNSGLAVTFAKQALQQ